MSENFDHLIDRVNQGDPAAAHELFPLIYEELRSLARKKLRGNGKNQIHPTSLVHEVFVKLGKSNKLWNKTHLFATAAEAMRCILVDRARRNSAKKRGGDYKQVDLDIAELSVAEPRQQVIRVSEALEVLEKTSPTHAQVVKLRYFAGLTTEQIGELTEVSRSTVDRRWRYAKAMLLLQIQRNQPPPSAAATAIT